MGIDLFGKLRCENSLHICIGPSQQLPTPRKEARGNTDARKEGRHFRANESTANDDETFWGLPFQREKIVTRPDRKVRIRRRSRVRAGRDDNILRCELPPSRLDHFWPNKTTFTANECGSRLFNPSLITAIDPFNVFIDALEEALAVDPLEIRIDKMAISMAHVPSRFCEPDQEFRWNTAPIRTSTAEAIFLNERDLFASLRGCNCES